MEEHIKNSTHIPTNEKMLANRRCPSGKIHCGNCGSILAEVSGFSVPFDPTLPTDAFNNPKGGNLFPCVAFPSGWLPTNTPDGPIWRMTNHARNNMAHGRSPSVRRQSRLPAIRDAVKPSEYYEIFPGASLIAPKVHQLHIVHKASKLPVWAECNHCGTSQYLDAGRLLLAEDVEAFGAIIVEGSPGAVLDVSWPAYYSGVRSIGTKDK